MIHRRFQTAHRANNRLAIAARANRKASVERQAAGFTLIELLVVIAIIAVLLDNVRFRFMLCPSSPLSAPRNVAGEEVALPSYTASAGSSRHASARPMKGTAVSGGIHSFGGLMPSERGIRVSAREVRRGQPTPPV